MMLKLGRIKITFYTLLPIKAIIIIVRVIIKNTFGFHNTRRKYKTAVAWGFSLALEKTNKNANHLIGVSHFYLLSSLMKKFISHLFEKNQICINF